MKELIEKLGKRKKITEEALVELFDLISELEKNLDIDITTQDTKSKVNIKAEDYYAGELIKSNDKFSLFVENGKIKIKDIFRRIKRDEATEIKLSHSFNYFMDEKWKEDRKLIKINFSELIKVLEELIALVVEESFKIDNDAQEFIDFCANWKQKNELRNKYYDEIQEEIKELNEIENVEVVHSYNHRKKKLKIYINTKEYKPKFGTQVYFGEFKEKHKEKYNTPEQLLSILKKLFLEESIRNKNESTIN